MTVGREQRHRSEVLARRQAPALRLDPRRREPALDHAGRRRRAAAAHGFGPGVSAAPVWSPDGTYIAVATDLYPECGIDAACDRRSPTGSRRASSRCTSPTTSSTATGRAGATGRARTSCSSTRESGKVVKDLTPGPLRQPRPSRSAARGFAFSPDGKELCFVSNHDARTRRARPTPTCGSCRSTADDHGDDGART